MATLSSEDRPGREVPDDAEVNALLADSEDLPEALGTIATKYEAQVTNNEPRWQDGHYLRHVGDFMRDVMAAFERFAILAAKAEGWDSAAVNLSGMGYTEQEALERNPYRAEPGAQL